VTSLRFGKTALCQRWKPWSVIGERYGICFEPNAQFFPRGLHSTDESVRSRVFYLFHKFIREGRNDISPELAISLLGNIRDLLVIQIEVLKIESPEDDPLTEAIKNPGIFDSQLYIFETIGILLSLLSKAAEQQASLLLSIVTPLLEDLSTNISVAKGGRDVIPILRIHHTIMALGNIAKGFPDYPFPVPEGYTFAPLEIFRQVAQGILLSLEAMNTVKCVRDAVNSLPSLRRFLWLTTLRPGTRLLES
jgi:exportin-T